MLGADKVVLPSKHDDGTQLRAVLNKLGLPVEKEKYDIKFEAKDETTKQIFEAFKEKAFEAGILPKQAEQLFTAINQKQEEATLKEFEDYNKALIAEQDTLKKEWGQGFDANINIVKGAIKHLAGDDQALLEHLTSDDLGADPKFIKIMHKVGLMLKEDNIISDGAGKWGTSPEDAKKQIGSIISDANHPYNNRNHPNHLAAVQEVYKLHEMLG